MLQPNLFIRSIVLQPTTMTTAELERRELFQLQVHDPMKLRQLLIDRQELPEKVPKNPAQVLLYGASEKRADVSSPKKLDQPSSLWWSNVGRRADFLGDGKEEKTAVQIAWSLDGKTIALKTYATVPDQKKGEEEWSAWGKQEILISLSDVRAWNSIEVFLTTSIHGDAGRSLAIGDLFRSATIWQEANSERSRVNFERAKQKVAEFCIIKRTASSILGIELPLTQVDVKKIGVLIGFNKDTVAALQQCWQQYCDHGLIAMLIMDDGSLDTALELEFEAVVRREDKETRWSIGNPTMPRKDLGREAIRQYQQELADPAEAIVDRMALDRIATTAIETVQNLNNDNLWQTADRKLREVYDWLSIPYE